MKYRATLGASSALQINLVTESDDYLERPQRSLCFVVVINHFTDQ
jgi:hypothetical protein